MFKKDNDRMVVYLSSPNTGEVVKPSTDSCWAGFSQYTYPLKEAFVII